MRKLLIRIEYGCFTVSIVSLIFVMFLVGDTDMISEPPPWVTTVLVGLACLSALIGAALHWVGLPLQEAKPKTKKKE